MGFLMALSVLTVAVAFLPGAAAVACNPVPHGPILIKNDADFTAANGVVSGTGTSSNPFVISSLLLNDFGPGFGLKVDNSKGTITKFFNVTCSASNPTTIPSGGSSYLWLVSVHTATTISSVTLNTQDALGVTGVRLESSGNVVLDGLDLNRVQSDDVAIILSDHITVINSKLKGDGNGVLVKDSHDIQIGQPCNLAGSNCNEFTYDDKWGVRIVNSFNVNIVGTKANANDTGGYLLDGAGTHNVVITGSQADGTGDICNARGITGERVDYMAGLAIINGAHDISVKGSTFQGNTHFSMENGGDTMWFNACTGFFEVIQKKGTPGGGANLDVNGNCYFNQFGFKPVPTKVC